MGDQALKQDALARLRSLIKKEEAVNWPGAIAAYVLEYVSKKEMLDDLSQQPTVRAKQMVQANFYLGVVSYSNGDIDASVKHWKEACKQCVAACLLQMEYYLAKGELVTL